MTTETLHDGDFELRPADAPREWFEFKREARFRARIRDGRLGKIELFPRAAGGPCDGLCADPEDDCDDEAIATVTDEVEIEGCRALCEAHLVMYLADVIPAVHSIHEAHMNLITSR